MQNTIKTILAARRKRFLQSKPVFHPYAPAGEMELFIIARKLNCKFTVGLSKWLRSAGYGDINDSLIFREDYFVSIEHGPLAGCITFARDELGNAYAFDPKDGAIYFVGPHSIHARMAKDFLSFLQELVQRDYNLSEWRKNLPLGTPADNGK